MANLTETADTETALAGALEMMEIFKSRLDAVIERRALYSHAAKNATQLMEAETDAKVHYRLCRKIASVRAALAAIRSGSDA